MSAELQENQKPVGIQKAPSQSSVSVPERPIKLAAEQLGEMEVIYQDPVTLTRQITASTPVRSTEEMRDVMQRCGFKFEEREPVLGEVYLIDRAKVSRAVSGDPKGTEDILESLGDMAVHLQRGQVITDNFASHEERRTVRGLIEASNPALYADVYERVNMLKGNWLSDVTMHAQRIGRVIYFKGDQNYGAQIMDTVSDINREIKEAGGRNGTFDEAALSLRRNIMAKVLVVAETVLQSFGFEPVPRSEPGPLIA